ncbi:MAG: S8 family serine peptidase [Enterocloster bolteae]
MGPNHSKWTSSEHFTWYGVSNRYNKQSIILCKTSFYGTCTDSTGHGTSVASIIAGSPNDVFDFTGVAPKTELVVKLKEAKRNIKKVFCVPDNTACYLESDIMLGVRYVFHFQSAHRPIVICLALGSSQGGHDRRS